MPSISYFKYLQHFVPVVVDDFDSDFARFRFLERSANRAVQAAPGRFVDLRPQRPFEFVVWFFGSGFQGLPFRPISGSPAFIRLAGQFDLLSCGEECQCEKSEALHGGPPISPFLDPRADTGVAGVRIDFLHRDGVN